MNDYLMHVGVSKRDGAPVGSGRYPLGSGEHPYGQYHDFYSRYNEYKKQGLTEKQIADKLEVYDRYGNPSPTKLRARYSLASDERRAQQRATIMRLADEGKNNSEIGRILGINESTVRSLKDEGKAARGNLTKETADILKAYVDKKRYVDVGEGIEIGLGVPRNRMNNALAYLEEQGYKTQLLKIDQMGTNHKTTLNILTPPDVTYQELSDHRYDIQTLGLESKVFGEDKKLKKLGLEPATSISSDRIKIKYNEEGGIERDGIIELRRGVDDISLGSNMYAQVRIAVDGTHYLKGMAVYSDNIPPGFDIVFNTNKHVGTDKYDVFKKMKADKNGNIDWDNPFGASVHQKEYVDINGEKKLSAINYVNEQGEWQTWSKNLPSQFLSKQPLPMAKRQLDISYLDKKVEYDEICKLTNPTVKKKLLIDFADNCDAAAVDLKAAPYARQQTHVLLAFPELSDREIYAPNYEDGATVALVRFPHQSPSEIPILTVRNTGSPAADIIKNAPDAVAVNAKVLERMSGADSDGDTAIVIPITDKVKVKNAPVLEGLKGFDPKEEYVGYPGMPVIKSQTKQTEMGKVTNLIMDMTLQGADGEELTPAIKHAQCIIDAEKHELDYKRSAVENRIDDLKKKWQAGGGAYTIVSRAGGEYDVPERKEWRPSADSINPDGSKKYTPTENTFEKARLKGVKVKDGGEIVLNTDKKTGGLYYLKKDPSTGKRIRVDISEDDLVEGSRKVHTRMEKSSKMAETTDAYTLTSGGSKEHPGYPMEKLYAEYANNCKALANRARLEWLKTPNQEYKREAADTYREEVASLNHKLALAKANAPRERQAQLLANEVVAAKKRANPEMTNEEEKRMKGQAINAARLKVGAEKKYIEITDNEWKAIQAGAVSHTKLEEIMKHANTEVLRERATPRARQTLNASQKALAKRLAANGFELADIAKRLGVSTSTISRVTNEKGDAA